jgi:HEAT repeat protein
MGPEKYPAVPAILRAINDEKNDGVRCWAGSALNRLDQRAVPALCKGLEGSGMISLLITDVLEGMGPKAKRSVPCLLKVFKGGGSEELREAVGFALWQIDPEAAAKNGAKKPQTDP